jgi:hypothetical protein
LSFSGAAFDREKSRHFFRTSTHEEPDSRAVSAKAAAGLPQSKELRSSWNFL